MNIHAIISLAAGEARDKKLSWGDVVGLLQRKYGLTPRGAVGTADAVINAARISRRAQRIRRLQGAGK